MKKTLLLILASLVLISSSIAGVPQEINYQGMLQDSSGTAIDDTVKMIFTIYESTTATANLWTETQTAVTVEAGIYNVRLGSVTPIQMSVFQDGLTKYLGVTVGTDSEMTPRLPIVAVPYAIYATSAESATYATNAKNAENATTADSATTAQSAVTAQTAITAESISTAVDAETVDGFSASSVPTAGTLLALDGNGTLYISKETKAIQVIVTGDDQAAISAEAQGGGESIGVLGYGFVGIMGTSDSGYGLYGRSNTGWAGIFDGASGVAARGTNLAGLFEATASGGKAISAEATNTGAGTNYGGYFKARGTTGRAVYGEATNTGAVTNYGGYFIARGASGKSVFGGSSTGIGVDAETQTGIGMHTLAAGGTGLYAQVKSSYSGCAISAEALNNDNSLALNINGRLAGMNAGSGNTTGPGTRGIVGKETLTNATLTVYNPYVKSTSYIFLTPLDGDANPTANSLRVSAVTAGNFTVTTWTGGAPSDNAVDFVYLIIN